MPRPMIRPTAMALSFWAPPSSPSAEPYRADYVLTYLDDLHVDFEKNRALYERMKLDPGYEAILTHEVRGCNLILYRKK